MPTQKIYSNNATYQKFEVLKTNRNKRYKYSEFLVEGVRNINEAIKNGWTICSFIYTFETKLSDWARNIISDIKTEMNYELTMDLMKKISSKEDTSELLAVVKMRKDTTSEIKLSANPLLAIFDRPSNKGNLGTLIRSCDSLGVEGLIITGHGVDLYDPDVISSSMGSFFKVPVLRASSNEFVDVFIEQLRSNFPDVHLIGTTAHSEKAIYELDLTGPVVFMIGNETDGLCYHYKEISDIMTTIPMAENSSASSFNVACASTVMFYEAVRQRSFVENRKL
ncbi:MAG: hypothetical protein K0S41_1884 [Anaerocolumna sp.]|jgi:TrmH family RNA methyltransferase|nr:hypothetical protein [Anaerocolumna sp.]